MSSRSVRDRSSAAAVEPNRVKLSLERRRLSRRVVDELGFLIDRFYARHCPFPARHLIDDLSGIVIAVDMLPSVAVGDPEEFVRPCGERDHVLDARVEIVDV